MKKCTKCYEIKELSEFSKDVQKRDGKRSRCKLCERKYIPEMALCFWDREWFLKKQSTQKFCKNKCRDSYWSRIWKLSVKGHLYEMTYWKNRYKKSRELAI